MMKSINLIKDSILIINKQLKKKERIIFKRESEILGPKSNLDSFIIINLFTVIEEKIKSIRGKKVDLLGDEFFKKSFDKKYTIGDLEKYIDKSIK